MGLLKRKISGDDTTALLQSESQAIDCPTEPQGCQLSSSQGQPGPSGMPQPVLIIHDCQDDGPNNEHAKPPDDLLNPELIGRTIKLVRADNWEQDILPTPSRQTEIIYENQRGMFWFGKPYFSGNSLIRTLQIDPPHFQRTSTLLTLHPGTIDPSDPMASPKSSQSNCKRTWPPDPSRLYYSTYGPHSGILELDSLTATSFKWKQDRWYVDMRGDVDEEGWEYAFIWDGKYWWVGGNWHGKSVFGHALVRRRRWVRDLVRRRERKAVQHMERGEVGKVGGGGFDELLPHLRRTQTSNLRRNALKDFFGACLPDTLKQLSSYIQRIYMLLDPLSRMDLIRILESQLQSLNAEEHPDNNVASEIEASLEYLNSRPESLDIRIGKLPPLKLLPENDWTSETPISPSIETQHPLASRRTRLRKLRSQWRQSSEPISKLARKVRFQTTTSDSVGDSPETPASKYVDAPEEPPRLSDLGRAVSVESGRDEWFIAPESSEEKIAPARTVGGLLKMSGELSGQAEEREQGSEEARNGS